MFSCCKSLTVNIGEMQKGEKNIQLPSVSLSCERSSLLFLENYVFTWLLLGFLICTWSL